MNRWYVALIKDGEAMLVDRSGRRRANPFKSKADALADIAENETSGWVH